MNQHEEVFLSVLRSALWGHPVQVPDGFNNWGAVMKLANMQAVNGLVWDIMVTNQKIKASIPEQAVAAMSDIPKNNLSMHTKLNNALILVVTTLREHGIEPVLLKGQGLARYYPIPELRQCGDIDLYVGVENYEKSYDVLKPIVCEIEENIWRGLKHYHARVGSVLVEVHRYANVYSSQKQNSIYRPYEEEGLRKNLIPLEFGGIKIMTPAYEFNAYYLFNHIWVHFLSSGVGLRQLCDWSLILNSHDVASEYLNRILTDMNSMNSWQIFGCVLVDYLGLPQEKFPFYNSRKLPKAKRLLKMILEEGNFGHSSLYYRERNHGYLIEKLLSLKWHISRRFKMFMIFPYQAVTRFFTSIKAGISQVLKDLTAKLRR